VSTEQLVDLALWVAAGTALGVLVFAAALIIRGR
jgi:hypothetical protein